MNEEEIEIMTENIVRILGASDARKQRNESLKKEEDVEEEHIQVINEDNDIEEELHVAIAHLSGALFKTHKELTLKYCSILYNQVLTKVLAPGLSDKMHKFGIFIVDDMIEHLGIELIPNEWPHLSEALIRYATDKNCAVRQAAVYGIGVLAEKSKEIFGAMAGLCLKTLEAAYHVPQGNENNMILGHCRDNTIAAVGKIIKAQGDKLGDVATVIRFWVQALPLKHDIDEGSVQHQLLVEILEAKPELVLGAQGEMLGKVCAIFAEIVETEACTQTTSAGIKRILSNWVSNEPLKSLVTKAVAELSPAKQARLQRLPQVQMDKLLMCCLLYTSPSPRDGLLSRMPSSA
eukprot:TRINITY_DN5079_c0_g1_i7.p1 TRINITY_DN5079_c0_g1~~TRINITY_DN5079_c0_g1_i7.p1  ORF type:complete len:348 (+),score=120.14 TRINITY_DN5079_c0_g1_i7:414-1457(+)